MLVSDFKFQVSRKKEFVLRPENHFTLNGYFGHPAIKGFLPRSDRDGNPWEYPRMVWVDFHTTLFENAPRSVRYPNN